MTTASPEDRMSLDALTVAFAHAIDSMSDVEGIRDCFTEDAELDLSGIGLAKVTGRAAIGDFYAATFAANSHHAHYLSNFAITGFSGDTASLRVYVVGMARSKDGSAITVHGRYYFDCVRTANGWKFARYRMDFLLPL